MSKIQSLIIFKKFSLALILRFNTTCLYEGSSHLLVPLSFIPPLLPLITNAPVTTYIFRSIFCIPLVLGSSPGVKNLLRSLTALPSTSCRLSSF